MPALNPIRLSCASLIGVVLVGGAIYFGATLKKPLSKLTAHVGIQEVLPDPAKIASSGDWYFLGNISNGLVDFDHTDGKFKPLLAEKWESFSTGVHTFTLREDAKFQDGTPITSEDVIASIKRLLIKRTATHFRLWEYIEGCENLKDLTQECSGLHAVNHRMVEIRLKSPSESFFLQLASPETSIWSHQDIDEKTLELKPTKFSGPYSFTGFKDRAAILVRNEQNPISKAFPQSAREIHLVTYSLKEAEEAFKAGKLDVIFKGHNPYGESDWKALGFEVRASSLSKLIYLHGASSSGSKNIGRDFVEALWKLNTDKELVAAKKFLPFAGDFSLSEAEFLRLLPEKSAKLVRIAVPYTYFSDGFLNLFVEAGKSVGIAVEIVRLERSEFFNSFEDRAAGERFDFILAPYAASERYPAVQLRYITGSIRQAPIDLKKAETPDLTPEKIDVLKKYQAWLLESQHAIPAFFARVFFLYQKNIDIGEQPPSDAEIELWRVTQK